MSRVVIQLGSRSRWRRRSRRNGHRELDHRGRSSQHDGAARHQGLAAWAERQSVRAESGELRRGARQSVSEAAGAAHAEERPDDHQGRSVVETAASGDRRGVRTRDLRTHSERGAEGDVVGRRDARRHDRRAGSERPSARGTRRQFVVSGDQRRDSTGRGDARHDRRGRRGRGRHVRGARAADDHVPRRHAEAGAGPRADDGIRRQAAASAAARQRSSRVRTADRRRLGLRVPASVEHSGGQRRGADERHHRSRQQGPAAQA